ncbi:septal ring lytic transglycosylase RlpA family protein [Qipengyuania sp. JC766]|uniref:septal ring lytic transglycosylase RlpA family protein n=1 Tax=Qipengyuania sp. JC766 TaxID=3232139 RepID=UPI00345AEAA3
MTDYSTRARMRMLLAIGALTFAVPASAALAEATDDATTAVPALPSPADQSAAIDTMPSVEESFDAFETLPPAPEASGNEVDLETIEVPVEPEVTTQRSLGSGIASYYGKRFHGRRTANGERFDMNAMTAAHKTLPFGSKVRVTNKRTGKSVIVRINDRGPFVRGRHIDVSRAAATEIGLIATGHASVDLELVS